MRHFLQTSAIGVFTAAAILASVLPGHAAEAATEDRVQDRIDVAFVLDTTGSMASLIDGAKRKIWSIANTIVDINPDAEIRMALIGYRDKEDAYVLKIFDMSTDIQGLYGNLVAFEARGGGDRPESVNEALDESIRNLDWSTDDTVERIVFLVGDAPPHMDYDNAPRYPEIIDEANKKNILINAVQAGADGETRKIWQDIARRGQGKYIQIPQDGGRIVIIETPFDGDIIILQQRLDKTVIPYGTTREQDAVRQKMSTKAAASEAVQVENSKFYASRSYTKEVITGGGDLIADLRNGLTSADDVVSEKLPQDVQKLGPAEQKAYIEEKLTARAELEETMKGLIEARDRYVAEKSKTSDDTDGFDKAVRETLREQLGPDGGSSD